MSVSYLQPEYFQKFQCIGGECPLNCCDIEWNIYWYQNEVDHLNNSEISDDFRKKFAELIAPAPCEERPDRYVFKMQKGSGCPFHNPETGLCDIQREVGADKLSATCRLYPRRFFNVRRRVDDNIILRTLSASCPAVVKLIMHDKKASEFEMVPARDYEWIDNAGQIGFDKEEALAERPFLEYRYEIIEYYSWLFSGKTDFITAMLTGALAADRISRVRRSSDIPQLINVMKKDFTPSYTEGAIGNVPTMYTSKANIAKSLLSVLNNPIPVDISVFGEGDEFDPEKYHEGLEKFSSAIHNADTALKNIAMNILAYTFPFCEIKKFGFFGYYAYFVTCMTTIDILAAAAGYTGDSIEQDFIYSTSEFVRRIAHSVSVTDFIVDYLGQINADRIDYIASFIKR